jgi:hypothetical protein
MTLTFAELNAEWHLGDDSIAAKARKALASANVTPSVAAAMTPKQLAAIPGIGTTRLARVKEYLRLWATTAAKESKAKALEAAKRLPDHCGACGGRRATAARNVVRDVAGHYRAVAQPGDPRPDPCQACDQHHANLVTNHAAMIGA